MLKVFFNYIKICWDIWIIEKYISVNALELKYYV